ncbi:hypothetical protein HK103_002892 [Boothiomyces macroporosus]|uniref:5'-3' exoribonuclease 1 n=1 Tax=Boothiomyces macroporosus TaxID=261099 RepID=A0AAD5U9A5_9FUNG|nr:hypothetical protein HK103_002892 [Boothiomyces macroporosus]
MNGIIHNCSHPNDSDPLFRITEAQIFVAIFNYIDYIFAKIKPRKVFMMAIDGVAPRAKMNQQRSRRFRSALDAQNNAEKALKSGAEIPKEPAFDSNCITPGNSTLIIGTPFMERLHSQLLYFVNKKITEDANWKGVTVILSGHNVPGEGEHKIMKYIREIKQVPGLYGLDADLIMLGLLCHEPHFSLLREEVTFGQNRKKGKGNVESQNFYLMHLSLVREYLSFEFKSLESVLPFKYDLERIIDDVILMCFFIGNDFLPHLPGLHINEGALATFFDIYKSILPTFGGYMNEHGDLNLHIVQKFVSKLADLELEEFRGAVGDAEWLASKGNHKVNKKVRPPKELEMSAKQFDLYVKVKSLFSTKEPVEIDWSKLPERDRKFVLDLADKLGVQHSIETEGKHSVIKIFFTEDEDDSDEEGIEARERILKKYEKAKIVREETAEEIEAERKRVFEQKYSEWKTDYYKSKLEFSSEAEISKMVFHYIEGIQWVLYYYYKGVPSWEWFYPYHYTPKISDIANFDHFKFDFNLGKPFRPFEQLMAVLPPYSKQHVPPLLQDLMVNIHSPIIDFYPLKFELDMNGKKADWEAIVKIPFIDEARLLNALKDRQNLLSKEEKKRNSEGPALVFRYSSSTHPFKSLLPNVFPDIPFSNCKMEYYVAYDSKTKPFLGLLPGARLGTKLLPGFPSFDTLKYNVSIGYHGVNVFNSDSKNPSVVLSIKNQFDSISPEEVAKRLIGKIVFSGWPFLVESKVVSISDEFFVYELKRSGNQTQVIKIPHSDDTSKRFWVSSERAESYYSKRCGVVLGPIDICVKVETLQGMQLLNDGSIVKKFTPKFDYDVPLASLVLGNYEDPRFKNKPAPKIEEEFPVESQTFFLSPKLYGLLGTVISHNTVRPATVDLRLGRFVDADLQNELQFDISQFDEDRYYPSWQVGKRLKVSAFAMSKITSNLIINTEHHGNGRVGIGLGLKYDSKGLKVLGYSRKTEKGWEFSEKALDLITRYQQAFPSIFARLEKNPDGDYYKVSDFTKGNPQEFVKSVKAWLKENYVDDLLSDAIKYIDDELTAFKERANDAETEVIDIKGIPRKNILKPAHASFRLSNQQFKLGDRVVNCTDDSIIPVGTKGFVAGIEGDILDIVFDGFVMGGSDLNGRCADNRGISCPKWPFLNLTNIQPPYATNDVRKAAPVNKKPATPKHNPNSIQSSKWNHGAPNPRPVYPPNPQHPVQPSVDAKDANQVEQMLKSMLHIGSSTEDVPPMPAVNPYMPQPATTPLNSEEASKTLLSILHHKPEETADRAKENVKKNRHRNNPKK